MLFKVAYIYKRIQTPAWFTSGEESLSSTLVAMDSSSVQQCCVNHTD